MILLCRISYSTFTGQTLCRRRWFGENSGRRN